MNLMTPADKAKQIQFHERFIPGLKARFTEAELNAMTDADLLALLPDACKPTPVVQESRALLKQLLRADNLDTDNLANAAAGTKCFKCRGTDVEYTAVQTRSADEPMTIFYHCVNPLCRARWHV